MAEFRVLGPVQVLAAGGWVETGPPKQQAVLATLLVDAGRPVSVDRLVERVWGPQPPAQARAALYTHIMRIRRVLERATEAGHPRKILVRGPAGYTLTVDPDRVDLHRFRRLVRHARDHAEDDPRRLAGLREAVALWRGQPLAGIRSDWADRMRHSWRQQYLDAVVCWAQAELRGGDPTVVCRTLGDLAGEEPLHEPLAAVVMRSLGAVGRTAEALAYYAAVRRRLADELGTDPGPELRATHQALLRGESTGPGMALAPWPGGAPVTADRPDSGATHQTAVDSEAAADPEAALRPGPGGPAHPMRSRHRTLATGAMLILAYLTTGLVSVHSTSYATRRHSLGAFGLAVAGLLISVGIVIALTLLYGTLPRRRWFCAATGGALVVLLLAVLPSAAETRDPSATAAGPRPAVVALVWPASTTDEAPLFEPSGHLARTLPAHSAVQVKCRYQGNPPTPWRANGVEYHVVTPREGHIPELYLTFGGATAPAPPPSMPRCGRRRPRH